MLETVVTMEYNFKTVIVLLDSNREVYYIFSENKFIYIE